MRVYRLMDNVASAFAAPPTAKAIRFEADTGAAVVLIVDGWQGFAVVSDGSGNLARKTHQICLQWRMNSC